MSALILAALVILPRSEARAGSAAQASARFLNLPVGARQAGMGQAGTGLADDVYAVHYNPAGLSQLLRQEAGFIHTQHVEGITYEYMAYAHPTPRWGTFAGNVALMRYGDIPGYDENDTPIGDVSASDTLLAFSWGGVPLRGRLPALRAGGSLKLVREKLDSYSASAYAADIGVLYPVLEVPRYSISAGLALRNLGSKLKFISESFDLPRTAVVGLGLKGWRQALSLALDAEIPQFGDPSVKFGAELWTRDLLALRFGYQSGLDLGPGVSGGIGLKLGSFQLDYAILPFGPFGHAHRAGVLFRFKGLVGDLYERGVGLMSKGHYAEALEMFTRVLTADPDNRKAVMRLRECQQELARQMGGK